MEVPNGLKRKIFISINLPDKVKKQLIRETEFWQELPVKWTKEQNLHMTLVFLGFVMDDAVADICETVRMAVENSEIFDVQFDKIELGPTSDDPKIIWLAGQAHEELRMLQENLEKALGIFVASKKAFRPHITLGRIRAHKWRELSAPPAINKNSPLIITVDSVDVMASEFENEGMEYAVIERCPLK